MLLWRITVSVRRLVDLQPSSWLLLLRRLFKFVWRQQLIKRIVIGIFVVEQQQLGVVLILIAAIVQRL